MPSQTKFLKNKSIKKSPKSTSSCIKNKLPSQKHTSFSTIFKNLELETACELPTIEEEKPELEA